MVTLNNWLHGTVKNTLTFNLVQTKNLIQHFSLHIDSMWDIYNYLCYTYMCYICIYVPMIFINHSALYLDQVGGGPMDGREVPPG